MSTISRQPVRRDVERGTPREVAIRWEIGARALLASRGSAVLNGEAGRMRSCALVVEIGEREARAVLEVGLEGGERVGIEIAAACAVERVVEQGLESVVGAGLIEAVLRGDELLYARTPLLEGALGLMGGVYDGPVAEAITD